MKEGWEYKTLGEVAKVFAGGDVPKNRMSKCKKEPFIIPIYTNGIENEGLYGYTDIARVNDLSLTISARGTIGAIFKRNNPFFPAIRLITVCPQNIVDINFLYYVLLNSTFTKSGTTIPQLTVPMLKQYRFAIPENIFIQQNIANYLDSSFKLIDEIKNKALKSLTEAKALFQSALAEAMEPKEGWEYKTLGECCDILDRHRKPIKQSKRESGNIPYYGATGLLDYINDYIFDDTLVLLGEDGAKWGAGDDSAFIISGKTWVNNHAHVLKPYTFLNERYLVYYLKMSNLSDYVTGVTVPKLNQEKMRQIIIPLTTLNEQRQIVSHLDSLSSKVRAIEEKYQKMVEECDALKQALLRDVFE